MPVTETQVSRADLATDILRGMLGDGKTHLNAPGTRGEAACHALQLDPVRTLVVADRGGHRLWSLNRLKSWRLTPKLPCLCNQLGIASSLFLLPSQRTFDSLGGFDTSGAHQLSRQVRKLCAQRIVGLFMQLYPVATSGFKTDTGNRIKACRMLLQRTMQNPCLFWRRFQLYNKCSIHAGSISYIPTFVNR